MFQESFKHSMCCIDAVLLPTREVRKQRFRAVTELVRDKNANEQLHQAHILGVRTPEPLFDRKQQILAVWERAVDLWQGANYIISHVLCSGPEPGRWVEAKDPCLTWQLTWGRIV